MHSWDPTDNIKELKTNAISTTKVIAQKTGKYEGFYRDVTKCSDRWGEQTIPSSSITDNSLCQSGSDSGSGSTSTSFARWSLSCSATHRIQTKFRTHSGSFLLSSSFCDTVTRNRERAAFGVTVDVIFSPPGRQQLKSSAKCPSSCEINPPWLTTRTLAQSPGDCAGGSSESPKSTWQPDPVLDSRSSDRTASSTSNDTFGHTIQPPNPGSMFRLYADSDIVRYSCDNTISWELALWLHCEWDVPKLSAERSDLMSRKPVSSGRKSSQAAKSPELAESEDEDESSSETAPVGVGRDPLVDSPTAAWSSSESDGVLPTCFRFNDPDLESRSRDDLESRSDGADVAAASIMSQTLLKNETACSRTWTTNHHLTIVYHHHHHHYASLRIYGTAL